jgi:hypothetical protein
MHQLCTEGQGPALCHISNVRRLYPGPVPDGTAGALLHSGSKPNHIVGVTWVMPLRRPYADAAAPLPSPSGAKLPLLPEAWFLGSDVEVFKYENNFFGCVLVLFFRQSEKVGFSATIAGNSAHQPVCEAAGRMRCTALLLLLLGLIIAISGAVAFVPSPGSCVVRTASLRRSAALQMCEDNGAPRTTGFGKIFKGIARGTLSLP